MFAETSRHLVPTVLTELLVLVLLCPQLEVKKSDRIIAVNGSSGSGQDLMKIIAARPI